MPVSLFAFEAGNGPIQIGPSRLLAFERVRVVPRRLQEAFLLGVELFETLLRLFELLPEIRAARRSVSSAAELRASASSTRASLSLVIWRHARARCRLRFRRREPRELRHQARERRRARWIGQCRVQFDQPRVYRCAERIELPLCRFEQARAGRIEYLVDDLRHFHRVVYRPRADKELGHGESDRDRYRGGGAARVGAWSTRGVDRSPEIDPADHPVPPPIRIAPASVPKASAPPVSPPPQAAAVPETITPRPAALPPPAPVPAAPAVSVPVAAVPASDRPAAARR